MYRVNNTAVMLTFLLQVIVGITWFLFVTPLVFDKQNSDFNDFLPSFREGLLFIVCTYGYLYFTAWLLSKLQNSSAFSLFILVVLLWIFVVLPNYIFVSSHLHFGYLESAYLLSYSAVNTTIAAVILPLWRTSSRSIFKD